MSEAPLPPDLESRLEGVLTLAGQGYFGSPLPCSEDAQAVALVERFAKASEAFGRNCGGVLRGCMSGC